MTTQDLHNPTPGKGIEKDSEVVNYQRLLLLQHPYPGKIVAVTTGPQAGNYIYHGPSRTWLPLANTGPLPSSLNEIGQRADNPLVYQFWQSASGQVWVVTMADTGVFEREEYAG